MNKPFLSVIIPAYNESGRIGPTLLSVNKYLKLKDFLYEIIVINDGSTDSTADIVTSLQTNIQNLIFINNKQNRGKGFAVNCGMHEAKGEFRLFMDADNSVKIDAVENFLAEMYNGYDVVIGSIALMKTTIIDQNQWYRRALGTISKVIIRSVALSGIYDTQRGFKLFSSKAANEIFSSQTIWRFGFDIELLVIARIKKFKIKELPVVWNNPTGSTVRLKDYVKTFIELFKIIFNKIMGKYGK